MLRGGCVWSRKSDQACRPGRRLDRDRKVAFHQWAEWQHQHSPLLSTSVPHPTAILNGLASEKDVAKTGSETEGNPIEVAGDPETPQAPRTLTLIGTPESHAGLQTGVYPTEVAEEWLHLLAGWLALLRDPGVDTAGHQRARPGILHARQVASSRDIRTGSRMPQHQVQRVVKEVRRQDHGQHWDGCPNDRIKCHLLPEFFSIHPTHQQRSPFCLSGCRTLG